jgi:tetratricopeptide (TPR) repeat protein
VPQDEFRIFLSAVTSEFGRARDAVAADLRSREALLRVQSDFRQEAGSDTTLRKLHDYIRDASAVVCIVGKRTGALPTPKEAEPFVHMLPGGIAKASYTQWEFFFARHFRRRLSIYIAKDDYQPDLAAPTGEDDPELQRGFCDHIVKAEGLDRSYFANEDQLARAVLKEDWPKKRTGKPIALPYPSLGSLFKGRDAFLKDLHASLSRGSGRTAITGSALHGLGGIGKTRAAVEYAWAHQHEYTALLFVIAETPEALRRNLAALAGPLVLNLAEQHAAEEDVRLKAVLHCLKEHPGWLVILDGLDTPKALEETDGLLGKLTGGRVLVTSRLANFAGHFDPLELDVLSPEDAVAFLLERTDKQRHKTPDDAATARQLADDLGRLALALEQAAAYVAKLGISFSRYRELWRDNWDKVARWSDERITKYPRAVAVTWQTSVNQLTSNGRRLLERLAWFAPEPIPNFLLEVPLPRVKGEDLADALANLADYSLARRNPDKQEFSIHRLVQEMTRRGLAKRERRRSLAGALAWIDEAFVGNPQDVRTWPRLDPIEPHVRVIVQHADGAEISEPTGRLMTQLGTLTCSKARYVEAEALCRRALAISEASAGPNHHKIATRLNNLAELLRATNQLNEAELLYRRALAIDEANYGPNHPNVTTYLNNLAVLLKATSRLSEAELLCRRALTIDEASYGPNHPNVAPKLNNLADLLHDTNRLNEAEPLYRRALAIDEASYGPNHPEVATDLNNLAELLQDRNRPNEAEPMYRRALAINEASFGPNHPNVATDLNNLAGLLQETNRPNEAEPMYRRALAIDEASYGPNHPNVATKLNNLAGLLQEINRPNEAEPMYRRALAIDELSYGFDHPNVGTRLNNLAILLHATNRLSEAEPMYRRALAICEASYGPNHPKVATDLNNLGVLLSDTNQLCKAEPLHRRALAIDEVSYGPNHLNVARDLNNLALLLWDTNRLSEAEPLYRRSITILARFTLVTDHQHPNLETGLTIYAQALSELGRTEAEIDATLDSIFEDARKPPP